MALAEIPLELTDVILTNIGKIGLYLQAIGIVVLVWLVFQAFDLKMNYQMKKKLNKVEKDILEIKKLLKKK